MEKHYSRYWGPLYGFFRRRLDTTQRAEELAQGTFVAVICGASRFESRPGPMLPLWIAMLFFPARCAWRKFRDRETPPSLK